MDPILLSLIGGLVPSLVSFAEKKFGGGGTGPKKRQWVVDAVHAFLLTAVKWEPSWLRPANDVVEPLIDEAIGLALDKLGLAA